MKSAWSRTFSDLLERGRKRQADVAKALKSYRNSPGAARTAVSRFLGGQQRPSGNIVREMNRAAGVLLGSEDVTHFLDALAIEEGLLETDLPTRPWDRDDPTTVGAQRFGAFSALYSIAMDYLVDGGEDGLLETIRNLSAEHQRKLATRLNRAWRAELVALLAGKLNARKPRFEEYENALEECGISLERWTKSGPELQWRRSRDAFFATVDDELADAIDDPQVRAKAHGAIEAAFARVENTHRELQLEFLGDVLEK